MHQDDLVIERTLLPYILFQRTEYLKHNPLFVLLSLMGSVKPLYGLSVKLKSALFAPALRRVFSRDMHAEYESIRSSLPSSASRILDIGCGVAGLDVFLSRHYKNTVDIYLLDKTAIDPVVYYGFKERGSVYNSLADAKDLLVKNGVSPERVHTQEATPGNTIDFGVSFDVILSIISWGYHYPVSTYLKEVHAKLASGGVLIIDVRKGTGGTDMIKELFGSYTVVEDTATYERILATKGSV